MIECGRAVSRVFSLLIVLGCVLTVIPALAAGKAGGKLDRFLKDIQPGEIFPGADRLERLEGEAPVARAYAGERALGYVFLNSDFANSVGYSGRPIRVLLALDETAVIVGAKLVEHHEPIVLVGIPERKIVTVIDGYTGLDVAALVRARDRDRKIDIVSGATVTVMVIDDSIVRAAIEVARTYRLGGLAPRPKDKAGPKAVLDPGKGKIEDWEGLLGDGSVRRLKMTIGEINRAFADSGDAIAAQRPEPGAEGDAFLEIYTALVSIPAVGRSLLGEREFKNLEAKLAPGQHAILVAGRGRYSFKGSSYVRGGIFDRFQLIQGDRSIRFRDRDHKRLAKLVAGGAPEVKEADLFRIPAGIEFDPAAPWRLKLLVPRATGPTKKAFLTFDLGYNPPPKFLRIEAPPATKESGAAPEAAGEAEGPPLWQRLWRDKIWEIAILLAALVVLNVIFFFQNWLVVHDLLTDRIRIGYLLFTLFGLGFYANAQLSVVNVMTFLNSLLTEFSWDYFLVDPLIFILWSAVAASLLFWGRGAFCGWLCPFGAMQELLNRAAKAMKVPQVSVPWGLHERLWPLKYMIFLALFGMSLYSLAWAERLAEVEPFKTAIVLKFMREWPYVLFAVSLLAAGLFIERFYCRYLCPLGAALAIPGRMRMFDWLKRYRECGSPCQRCAKGCMVQAIHPEGHINPNECLYCLHCQRLYYDGHRCPVVIQRRLKHERRVAMASKNLPSAKGGKTGKSAKTGQEKGLAGFITD